MIPEPILPGAAEKASWNGRSCGVILAWKTHDLDLRGDVIELFAWLHGPYRTLGIGRHYVGVAIDRIRERLNPEDRGLPLRVDYPMRDVSASPEHVQSIQGSSRRRKR